MRRLDASDSGFAAEFDALVNDRRESDSDVSTDVAAIIARVKAEGDVALADYTARFDRFDLETRGWSISKAEGAPHVGREQSVVGHRHGAIYWPPLTSSVAPVTIFA